MNPSLTLSTPSSITFLSSCRTFNDTGPRFSERTGAFGFARAIEGGAVAEKENDASRAMARNLVRRIIACSMLAFKRLEERSRNKERTIGNYGHKFRRVVLEFRLRQDRLKDQLKLRVLDQKQIARLGKLPSWLLRKSFLQL